jgi:hypothetical protein
MYHCSSIKIKPSFTSTLTVPNHYYNRAYRPSACERHVTQWGSMGPATTADDIPPATRAGLLPDHLLDSPPASPTPATHQPAAPSGDMLPAAVSDEEQAINTWHRYSSCRLNCLCRMNSTTSRRSRLPRARASDALAPPAG